MTEEPKEIAIVANVIDADGDGKADMVSFLNERGSVGLAIDSSGLGKVDKIYVFQDVTGDGKLDNQDEKQLEELANAIFEKNQEFSEEPFILTIKA